MLTQHWNKQHTLFVSWFIHCIKKLIYQPIFLFSGSVWTFQIIVGFNWKFLTVSLIWCHASHCVFVSHISCSCHPFLSLLGLFLIISCSLLPPVAFVSVLSLLTLTILSCLDTCPLPNPWSLYPHCSDVLNPLRGLLKLSWWTTHRMKIHIDKRTASKAKYVLFNS